VSPGRAVDGSVYFCPLSHARRHVGCRTPYGPHMHLLISPRARAIRYSSFSCRHPWRRWRRQKCDRAGGRAGAEEFTPPIGCADTNLLGFSAVRLPYHHGIVLLPSISSASSLCKRVRRTILLEERTARVAVLLGY